MSSSAKRTIQYSVTSRFALPGHGVLDTPLSRGMTASREARPGVHRRPAQEFRSLHRRLAGALQLDNADRAVSTGNRELIVEHAARHARSLHQLAAQDFHARHLAAARDLAPSTGKGRQPVDMPQDLARRLAPVDPRFRLLDLG